ncbi:tetratricopeptide repeat (TPR)-like superfamily protein [Artemisia annua]|uniref:Tetratricopeptide repeat (TPR)-like superfamily protein n=1 Tax=Artemisia annua TaxID=35608 RepID=A0A2U1LIL3_ARTAN|nr:tetratricopeptide repeat (TPR)-like superfamily protein [Artemisia annua]
MPLSPESLLQLLQKHIKNPTKIKQIHSILTTLGDLTSTHNRSLNKWTPTLFYNTLLRSYVNINPMHTLHLFKHMHAQNVPINSHTFPSVTKALNETLFGYPFGSIVYGQCVKRGVLADPFVQTGFVGLFAKNGCVWDACKVFDEMFDPCLVACNAMLDGFCRNGEMSEGCKLFEQMEVRDVYTWTSVVNGFGKVGCYEDVVWFFRRMVVEKCRPNEATFVSVISACGNCGGVGGLLNGKEIHGYVVKNEGWISAFVGTALISFYGNMGGLVYAMNVFRGMVHKEVCTWNAMIGALASNGKQKEALDMFDEMKSEGWRPNEVTFVAVLSACARAKFISTGLEIFDSMLTKFGVTPLMEHYGCVVDLLGRAGFLEEAKAFIKRMPFEPDVSVLGALLGACKLHRDIELGNEVANRIRELQPQLCGQYVLLSSINAEAEKWDNARSLRNVMVDAGIQKPPAYSMVKAM